MAQQNFQSTAVQFVYPTVMTFDASGILDFNWYKERTGYVQVSNGQPMFGY